MTSLHVLSCVVMLLLSTSDGLRTRGTDFVITFMDNEVEYWQPLPLEVWVINDGNSPATVSISSPRESTLLQLSCTGPRTVMVAAGDQYMFGVCWWAKIFPSDSSINGKTIRVVSDSDVSVIGVNKAAYSSDSFQVLPIASLGTSYYTVVAGPGEVKSNSFAVIATEDDTSVTIALPAATVDAPPVFLNHRCLVHEAGSAFTFRLFQYQVFSMMTLGDITGTKILSSSKVAVFVGNVRASVPSPEGTRDHLCEQAISVGNWDREYVYIPILKSAPEGDIVRVISDELNTRVNWVSSNGSSGSFFLGIGQWRQLLLTDHTYLSSSNRFSATLITQTHRQPSDGVTRDPAMINLQGLNQWTTTYTLPAYRSAQSTLNNQPAQKYFVNFLMITVNNNDVGGLRLDGQPINSFDECRTLPGNLGLQACIKSVDGQISHILTHVNGASFGAYAFSSSSKESMGSTLGLRAPPMCEVSVMRWGDGQDNDCDGTSDEEVCDGVDNDGDGRTDEDCARSEGKARGRTYVLTFPDNFRRDGGANDLNTLELYISPQNTSLASMTTVTVSNPLGTYNTTRFAPPNNTTKITVPIRFKLPQASGKYNKSLLIQADQDIVVYALNKYKWSSESYLGIPVDGTGYDYYVATYTVVNSQDDAALIAVCAADPDTTVLDIRLANIIGISVDYEGRNYGSGELISTTLLQYECLQLQSPFDLTGSRVRSTNNKRISVFSGNRRPVIGGGSARDHIVEMMPPVPSWGRQFFSNPIMRDGTDGSTRGDIVRVVTSADDTTITLTTNQMQNQTTIPMKGGFMEYEIGSLVPATFISTKPILVVQYTKTQINNDPSIDKGDPSMTLVLPKISWTNDYRFVTPFSGQVDPNNPNGFLPYTSRMSIIIETQHISKLRYGTIDDLFSNAFPNANWRAYPVANPEVSALTVDVVFGQNYVTAIDDVVFSAMIYGAADREFYANPISLRLNAALCVESSPVLGDGVDNDCDGSIDEELCNDFDDDFDGRIDEDCKLPPEGFRYVIVFMDNRVEEPLTNPLSLTVSPTCSGQTSVRLQTPWVQRDQACDINVPVIEGTARRFALSDWYRPSGNGMFNKTLIIDADCNIDVIGYNLDKFSADGFLVLPITKLGREFRTFSYWPVNLGSLISVVGNGIGATSITVALPVHNNEPSSTPSVRHPVTNVTFVGGQSFQVDMAQFESMQLVSDGDLSGTVISSANNDIAVYSGNIRAKIGSKSRDHIVEQLTPWSTASNEWVVATNTMTSEEIIKFTCQVGTSITFPAYPGVGETTYTFTRTGQVEQHVVPRYYSGRVTSTGGNCQLVLITMSQATKNAPLLGDPTMSLIIPVSQYITSATYTIPVKPWRKLATGEVDDYLSHLIVATRTDQTGSIRLDNSPITGWTQVSNSAYSVARVQVQRRPNGQTSTIRSTNQEKFAARLWGVADRESYAFPLGINY